MSSFVAIWALLGVAESITGWEQQTVVSVVVASLALGGVYALGKLRPSLESRFRPVLVDLIISTIVAGIVILATLVIADIWSQTDVLLDQFGFLRLDRRAPQVAITVAILITIQVFSGIGRRLLNDLREESDRMSDHQREIGLRSMQLVFWSIGIMVILGVWEIDLSGLLVGAGFLGIVLGLASQKTLGSLIAGFILMFSRPFEVGDWIIVDENEGVVTDITLMSTRMRSFDGERIVIPNDVIASEIVTNRSREGKLRVEVAVGIDYNDDLEMAESAALEAASTIESRYDAILSDPEPSVVVDEFGDSAVELSVRVWVESPTAYKLKRVRNELMAELRDAFETTGVSIPYPQRQLSYREEVEQD